MTEVKVVTSNFAIRNLKCLHGCNDAILGIYFFEDGCICFKDKIQALCAYHFFKIESNYHDRKIVRLVHFE